MKTRSDFRMPHSVVWLLLVAILCVAVLPTLALAKVDMEIAREGDPGDGMDSDGSSGGGDGGIEPADSVISNDSETVLTGDWVWGYFYIVPYWNDQGIQFQIEFRTFHQKFGRDY